MKRLSTPIGVLVINRFVSLAGEYGAMITLSLLLASKGATALMFLWIIQSLGPSLVLPFAGRIIDSYNKKNILISIDIIRGLLILAVPFVLDSYLLYIIILLVSLFKPIFRGSMQPLITSLTTNESRQQVNSIFSSVSSAAYAIGPALGGLLLIWGNGLPFVIQAIGYFISAFLLFFVKYPDIPINITKSEGKFAYIKDIIKDMSFSTKFIIKNKIVFILLITNVLYYIGGTTIDAYEVLYVTEVLNMSETRYALAISYLGIAFIIAGLLNVLIARYISTKNLFVLGMFLASASNILFTTATSENIVFISFVLLALGITSFSTAFYSLNQSLVPIESQGRVLSFQYIIPQTFSAFTVLLFGLLLDMFEIRLIMVLLAVISFFAFLMSLSMLKIKFESKEVESVNN